MNPSLQLPEEGMTLEELGDFVANQMKRLNLVLKNLDGLNIVDIKFELQGGAYIQLNRKGLVFSDGTQDMVNIGIDGKAVLTGVKLQTKAGEFPNITLSADVGGDLLKASQSETNYISIDPDLTGNPAIYYSTPLLEGFIGSVNDVFWLHGLTGKVQLSANDTVRISSTGDKVLFDDWDNIKNSASGQTLQQALDGMAITSGDVTVTDGVATLGNNINTAHLADGSVSNTEFQYINSLTSNAQDQLNAKPRCVLGTGTTGTESPFGTTGIFYAVLTITYSGFTNIPRIIANNTLTAAAWVSAIIPSLTGADIYVSTTSAGHAAGVTVNWEAIGT